MVNCVYLHIPFCLKKCKYCSFCSFELLKYKKEYINSLIKEIKFYYKNEPLETIYFGGGTPYLLNVEDFKEILNCFNFDKNTEITLEINPYNVSKDKLKELKTLGINRLSFGVQSFDDDLLSEMGRLHSTKDIYNALNFSYSAGFDNISIDLMYGLANQTLDLWKNSLDKALELEIQHISLYGLKIEKGSYYYKNPPKNLADMDFQAKMYEIAISKLKEKFLHYEFSNFAAEEKYFSKHNLAYWKRKNYYGFGLSASGFLDNKRYTNTFNFKNYLINPIEKNFEELSTKEQIEEEIFLGLRKSDGLDFEKINEKYGIDIYKKYQKKFEKFLQDGFIKKTDKGICFTLSGILVSNEILCEFIEI